MNIKERNRGLWIVIICMPVVAVISSLDFFKQQNGDGKVLTLAVVEICWIPLLWQPPDEIY